jgi:hypothetical protein
MARIKTGAMRYLSGSVWTPQRDKRLRQLAAKGLSARQIGARIGVGRNAVIGRWARLRGLVFRCEVEREKKLRAEAAARRRKKQRIIATALSSLRRAMARGVARDAAIAAAIKAGATYHALAQELGLSRQRVHQIWSRPRRRARPAKS